MLILVPAMEPFVGSISNNPGSTSTRPTKTQGTDPIGFNPIGNTCEASEVSLEIPIGAAGNKFV